MPSLVITRDRGFADYFRLYRVLVDGELAGTVAPGGDLRIEVGPGDHVVEARIDWCGSQPFRFTATNDHHMEVKSALRGLRLVLAPLYILVLHRSYLTLDLAPLEAG